MPRARRCTGPPPSGGVQVTMSRFADAASKSANARVSETRKHDPEAAKIATLTEREREVITLVGGGHRNKQIADRLFISEGTVRNHLTSIFGKLEVSDRFELLMYAYRHGLAQFPP